MRGAGGGGEAGGGDEEDSGEAEEEGAGEAYQGDRITLLGRIS